MTDNKLYIVAKGRTIGVYTNWNDCNAQVKGYSGASFWSIKQKDFPVTHTQFKTYLDEKGIPDDIIIQLQNNPIVKSILGDKDSTPENTDNPKNENQYTNIGIPEPFSWSNATSQHTPELSKETSQSPLKVKESEADFRVNKPINLIKCIENFESVPLNFSGDTTWIDLWVDGSYNNDLGIVGSGVHIAQGNLSLYDISFRTTRDILLKEHQCSGEVMSVVGGLTYIEPFIQGGLNNIKIYYDYLGIEMWYNTAFNLTPSWKANSVSALSYIEFLRQFFNKYPNCKITFNKVESHTGIILNDRADTLARHGAGLFL